MSIRGEVLITVAVIVYNDVPEKDKGEDWEIITEFIPSAGTSNQADTYYFEARCIIRLRDKQTDKKHRLEAIANYRASKKRTLEDAVQKLSECASLTAEQLNIYLERMPNHVLNTLIYSVGNPEDIKRQLRVMLMSGSSPN